MHQRPGLAADTLVTVLQKVLIRGLPLCALSPALRLMMPLLNPVTPCPLPDEL